VGDHCKSDKGNWSAPPPTRHLYRKNKTCCIIKITSKKKKKGGAKTMGIKRFTLYYHRAKDNLNKKIKETVIYPGHKRVYPADD
jgi:hypothetical protein